MIDIENAKIEFINYVKNYDQENKKILLKISHSFRVMEQSKKLAESLNLDKEQVDLATLIGLLHDIGRFEQMKRYGTYVDKKSIDHGDLGVQILSDNLFIRKFITDNKYDNIILTAIKNHNKYKIEDDLKENELLQSKIIRDADKIDILYEATEEFWYSDAEDEFEEDDETIRKEYFNQIKNHKQIVRGNTTINKLEKIVSYFGFVFDFNFKYTFKVVYENDFVNKIIDRVETTNLDSKNQIEKIKKIVNDFLIENVK